MKRLRLRIHGIVQGVGFRWFVRYNARSLGPVSYTHLTLPTTERV